MKKSRFLNILSLIVLLVMAGGSAVYALSGPDRVMDYADLLSDSEESSLREKLDSISTEYECDVVAVTVDSMNGKTAQDFADDFYDFRGYGYGSDRSGILFLVDMGERAWAFSTRGDGIFAFNDDGLAYMEEEIIPYLSDGDYNGAFREYASLCEKFLKKAETGTAYSASDMPKRMLSGEMTAILAAGGVGLGFLGTLLMKGQLKSVRAKETAADYIRQGSFKLIRNEDTFLYSRVTKVPRPKDENRSGGGGHSTTHRSSSGASHGGRSGHF